MSAAESTYELGDRHVSHNWHWLTDGSDDRRDYLPICDALVLYLRFTLNLV